MVPPGGGVFLMSEVTLHDPLLIEDGAPFERAVKTFDCIFKELDI